MLIKKIIGIIILLLNIAGLGFLLYLAGMIIKDTFFSKELIPVNQPPLIKKKKTVINNDDILSDEDDLLKDMDLSDLDNLNLDDFE